MKEIIKYLKDKLSKLRMSTKEDFDFAYNSGYNVCIEDIERMIK